MVDDPIEPAEVVERPRGRLQRRHAELNELGGVDAIAVYFKERVYATFTGLAIVLVVLGGGHADAAHAISALILGVLGITAAGFVSDVISHLAAHGEFPSRREVVLMLKVAGGALGTLAVPVMLLALAAFDVTPLDTALRASSAVYIATLGLIGWIAVRRSRITWWKQLLALAVLMALGLGVVGLQILAHSV
jgi:hypothetical protein